MSTHQLDRAAPPPGTPPTGPGTWPWTRHRCSRAPSSDEVDREPLRAMRRSRTRGRVSMGQYDDAEYVFGADDERPKNTKFNSAGMDVSPAVNGCLGFSDINGEDDRVDWRFVEVTDVPPHDPTSAPPTTVPHPGRRHPQGRSTPRSGALAAAVTSLAAGGPAVRVGRDVVLLDHLRALTLLLSSFCCG